MKGDTHHASCGSIARGPDVPPKGAEPLLEAENPESLYGREIAMRRA